MSSNIENLIKQIINCAFQVHKTLGPGFLEKVYENSLLIELHKNGLTAQSQYPVIVFYDTHIVGEYLADIAVEGLVILELKAQKNLLPEHSAQLINYLKAGNIKDGLLIKFGSQKIEIKRLHGNRSCD